MLFLVSIAKPTIDESTCETSMEYLPAVAHQVSCISTSGYGQCSTDEMEKREVRRDCTGMPRSRNSPSET